MKSEIPFESINVVPSASLVVVSTFRISTDSDGAPLNFIFQICIDPEKAGTECVEIPLYIQAFPCFNSTEHLKMLENFRGGAPFCAIECEGLKVFKDYDKNVYFATANHFTTPESLEKWSDIC